MERRERFTAFLEKLFWIYLFLNPLLDILNGLYISSVMSVGVLDVEYFSTLGITPSLVLRMLVLLLLALYLLLVRDRKAILTAGFLGLAWALSVVSEFFLLGRVRLFIDIQYMARFCYNLAVLMVYCHVFRNRWGGDGQDLRRKLDAVCVYTALFLSLAILIPAVLGIGYSTYADRLGYRGNRGFFYAGNDVTSILTVLLPLTIARVLRGWKDAGATGGRRRFPLPAVLAASLSINAMLIIGSKTAFLAVLITALLFLGYGVIRLIKCRELRPLLAIVLILAVSFCVLLLLTVLSYLHLLRLAATDETIEVPTFRDAFLSGFLFSIGQSAEATMIIAEDEGAANALFNGRQFKLAEQLVQFRQGGIPVWLFGMGRGSQEVVVEIDPVEVLFYYGLFGVVAMLWLYGKLGVEFLRKLLRRFDGTGLALFLSLGMTVGYLCFAGHVLFSVTSGFYLAFAILYSRVCFAEKPEDTLLWRDGDRLFRRKRDRRTADSQP
jgi:hypothetical protein